MGLTYCEATHNAQKIFYEKEEELKHFLEFMMIKVSWKDPCNIINMDQSTIPYSFHLRKLLENKSKGKNPHPCINHLHLASYACCNCGCKWKAVAIRAHRQRYAKQMHPKL